MTAENEPILMSAWGNRARTPERIAVAFRSTMDDLGELDPLLTDWWAKERIPVRHSVEDLVPWIGARRVKGPPPGQGYRMSVVSNGIHGSGYALSVADGNTVEHPIMLNEVQLQAVPTHEGEDLFPRLGSAMLDTVVSHWAPDWAAVTSDELILAQPFQRRRPMVGGLTWLADHLGQVPAGLPAGARVRRLDHGTLIDLRGPDGDLPDVEALVAVERALDEAGVLGDIPQVQPERAAATES